MKSALLNNLQSIIGCFSKSTSDEDVRSELKSLCHAHGDNVTVARQSRIVGADDGKRHFLIAFQSNADAILFAHDTHRETYGPSGVMINVS